MNVDVQEEEAALFALREAKQGRAEYLARELRRPTLVPIVRGWLAAALDETGSSEFSLVIKRRSRGRPKGERPNMTSLGEALTADPVAPATRAAIADLVDPESQSEFKLVIQRRKAGNPSVASRKMVDAGYYVILKVEAGLKLESLLADTCKRFEVSRRQLLAHLKQRWPELSEALKAARRK